MEDMPLDARKAPMYLDIRIAEELQNIIDALPNTHELALYEAVFIDNSREPTCTKYFHAGSPEQARLKALKICRFDSGLEQAAYADVGLVSCSSSS
jgi:hypothetical protein